MQVLTNPWARIFGSGLTLGAGDIAFFIGGGASYRSPPTNAIDPTVTSAFIRFRVELD